MRDTMLCGFLRMPPELTLSSPFTKWQFFTRCAEAADELEEQAAEIERLQAALKPFAKLGSRIPDNWPDECPLRVDSGPDQHGDWYEWLSYHGVNDTGYLLPTIGEWREAASASGSAALERCQAIDCDAHTSLYAQSLRAELVEATKRAEDAEEEAAMLAQDSTRLSWMLALGLEHASGLSLDTREHVDAVMEGE